MKRVSRALIYFGLSAANAGTLITFMFRPAQITLNVLILVWILSCIVIICDVLSHEQQRKKLKRKIYEGDTVE